MRPPTPPDSSHALPRFPIGVHAIVAADADAVTLGVRASEGLWCCCLTASLASAVTMAYEFAAFGELAMPGQYEAMERLVARQKAIFAEMDSARERRNFKELQFHYSRYAQLKLGEIAQWAFQTKREAEAGDEEAKSIMREIVWPPPGELAKPRPTIHPTIRGLELPYEL
jgi:hypothetical protein